MKTNPETRPAVWRRGRTTWLRSAAALAAASIALTAVPATAPAATSDPALAKLAAAHPSRTVEVIVQLDRGASSDEAARLVRRSGGRISGALPIINGFGARMSAAAAGRLAAAPGVANVTVNDAVEPQGIDPAGLKTSFNESVGSAKVWIDKELPETGRGIGVAVLDTGIDGGHPDFRTADGGSRIVASAVVNPDATGPGDGYGHGTHVAGLIAGNSTLRAQSDPLNGDYAGSAPDASLINVKVSDDQGASTVLDVIRGLQFVVDHKDQYNIRVANLSLKSSTSQSYRTDPLDAAVEEAWFKGIVVVAAAGNDGSADGAVEHAPGNDPYVITVGGVDDRGTKAIKDDVTADWSSRGRTQDGFAKPEVMAPGVRLYSPLAKGSRFSELCPACVQDGEYIRASGSSMAAGVVSGTIALLLERHPTWSPDQVKGAVMHGRLLATGETEVAAQKAVLEVDPIANQGLVPNELIDPATGSIDYVRATWSRATWSEATDALRATWSRATWSCADCAIALASSADALRATWSRATWSTHLGD